MTSSTTVHPVATSSTTPSLATIPEGSQGFLLPSADAVLHQDMAAPGGSAGGRGQWLGEGQGVGAEEDDTKEDVAGQGLLETLTRSVAESFQHGYEPAPLPAVVNERAGIQQLDIGKGKYVAVVICGFLTFIVNGFAGGLGVLYVPLLSEFNTTSAEAGLVQSLANGVIYGGVMFAGMVVTLLGPGACCILGTVVAVLGCVASALAWSVPTLIVTVGVISGCGLSLVSVTSWATVGQLTSALPSWTPALLGLASATGVLVFPLLHSALLQVLSWRGVYLVLGGLLLLLGLPGGLFILCTLRRLGVGTAGGRRGCRQVLVEAVRPEVLRSWRCLLFALPLVPLYATMSGPLFFLVDIATDIGLDIAAGSLCLVLLGAMNVVARVLQAMLSRCQVPTLAQSSAACIMLGVVAPLFTLASSRSTLMAVSAAYGFFYGMVAVSYPLVVVEELGGRPAYAAAVGYILGVGGLGDLICGPLGGMVRDLTGRYDALLYLTVATSLFTSAVHVALACSCRGRQFYLELERTGTGSADEQARRHLPTSTRLKEELSLSRSRRYDTFPRH